MWSTDGRTLYYRRDLCDIYEVPLETAPNLVLGTPRKVVDCTNLQLTSLRYRCYTVSHDDSKFLMLQAIRPDFNTIDIGITVVENWAAEFAETASRSR